MCECVREPARRHTPWLAKGNKSFWKRREEQAVGGSGTWADARRLADSPRGLGTADSPEPG